VRYWVEFEAQKVSKRNCWVRDRESCMFELSPCVTSIYTCAQRQRLGETPGFDCSRYVSVLAHRSPPNTPWASDTVATFGFTRLPLCFTRVRWTAEFGARELAIVSNQLAKRCSPYRLFLVCSKGLKLLRFLFAIIKLRIGVMK
jgi:hypothetical protein